MALPAPPQFSQARQLVESVYAQSAGQASYAVAAGMNAITMLGGFASSIPEIAVPDFSAGFINLPAAGTTPADQPDLNADMPVMPQEPSVVALASLALGEAPTYDLAAPLLMDIALPDPLAALTPPAPELAVVGTPVEPGFALPDVPTFLSLTIPSAPAFDVPVFADVAPESPTFTHSEFVWDELAYASDALATLNTRLLSLVEGAPTALSEAAEEAIWQQAVDAQAMLTYTAVEDALQQVSARGFSIPSGQVVRIVQQAIQAGVAKDAETSRRIMSEQARLEQANFQFAFSNAIQFEARLIEMSNQVHQRALEAAKFRVETAMLLFNARVQLYQADVQAFGAKAEVFKTRLQAALAQLDLYRAQLDAVKLKGQLNVQLAEQYSAQVSGVKALAGVYRARVEAVSLAVGTNKNRTELYRAEIEAYSALSKNSAGQVRGYLAQVQGEQTKVELFSQQVAGYNSRIAAYGALTEARMAESTLQFRQLQQFPVELFKAKITGYQAQVSGEAARLGATAAVFQSRLDAYSAVERASGQRAGSEADVAMQNTRMFVASAKVAIQAGAIQATLEQSRSETAQAALRAAAQLSAQYAASATSARSVSASLTGSMSNGTLNSASNTKSYSSTTGDSSNSSTQTNFSSLNSKAFSVTSSKHEAFNKSETTGFSDSTDVSYSESNTSSTSNDTNLSARNSMSRSVSIRKGASSSTVYRHKGD